MKFLFVFTMLFSNITTAQTINPENRTKAPLHFTKHIETTTTTKMQSPDFNFTSGIQSITSSSYSVSATTKQGAIAEMKTLKMKVHSFSSMGKDTYYDSENPQAGDSKNAEQFSKTVGSITKYKLDENAIVIDVISNTNVITPNANVYDSIIKGRVFDIFLNVKQPQNIGDSWSDSTTTSEIKIIEKYTYKSFEKGIATIEVNSIMTLSQKIEDAEEETPKEISLTYITVSTLQVDIATLLIIKRSSTITSLNTTSVKEKTINTSSVTTSTERIE